MHIRAAVILLLAASTAFAQTPALPDNTAAIAEATAMMDAGKVDEAIAKLKAVLASEPSNTSAQYELGLAYSQKGEAALCRDTIQPLSAMPGNLQVGALATLATCFDQLSEPQKAIDTYRRGLALSPDDAQLNYNLAVTLAQTNKLVEARKVAKHGAEKNPWHASEHYLLGKVFDAEGFRVPAVFSYLHFLALEPAGARGTEAITTVRDLLWRGVTKTEAGGNITIDPDVPKEEGDFGPMHMALAISAANTLTEEGVKKSEFEKTRSMIASDVRMFIEIHEKDSGNYTFDVNRPFFTAMEKAKVLDAFAGIALSTLHLPGMDEWVKANAKEIEAYLAWIRPQRRPAPLMLAPTAKQ
jgi:tetratricopeptide (TPR) repeat protein